MKSKGLVIVTLLLLAGGGLVPIGLILAWTDTGASVVLKILVTAVFAFAIGMAVALIVRIVRDLFTENGNVST